MATLKESDPIVFDAIEREKKRQKEIIGLIASENTVSEAILAATGSEFTNKYAEGYPGARYYAGCGIHDEVEELAKERACEIFNAEHANVQSHCGTQANMAVYFAVLKIKNKIMAMSLDQGGHLSHGHKVNFSGRYYKVSHYQVDRESERLDYDGIRKMAREVEPHLILAGASAYPREIDFAEFRNIADEVGAIFIVDMAHIAGLIAAGVHPSPFPHADFVTSTTHKTLRGPRGGLILCREKWAQKLDKQVFPGIQGGPFMHLIAAKAVCFAEALKPEFKTYQRQVVANAKILAEELAGKDFRIVTGGTDNHLLLADLRQRNLNGIDAEKRLEKNGIVVNKNMIPYDPEPPMRTSGIRIGTPLVTSRGMREEHMVKIADFIDRSLKGDPDSPEQAKVADEVRELAVQFPIYTTI